MTTPRLRPTLSLLMLLALAPVARAEKDFSYSDLIGRMTDLAALAELPQPGETCQQWSSYDRASKYDAATGKYVAWDANGDGGGVIRTEGEQVVMAEMDGPGCIWRIWSAAAGKGHVKIYLDGQETPVVDMPFVNYFDGKHAPFNYPALAYNLGEVGCSGQNLYLPIPYRKSCRIVADKDWGNYYHFNYMTYPKGTVLPTFSPALVAEHAEQLQAVNDFLLDSRGTDPAGQREGQSTLSQTVEVAPGKTAPVARFEGPRAITAIRMKAKFGDRKAEMEALRRLALRITWDDESKPDVWCPLGDFFGTAPGLNPYQSLVTGMTDEGCYALWYMPFAKLAFLELVNDDTQQHNVQFEISFAPLVRPFEGLGHFHSKWHRDTVEMSEDRRIDWALLQTQGRGRFCGVMLHVWNPRGGWWGEGDEKFFVDGEKFPSTIGTGSEDYFGYAWCNPNLFQQAYHCQTMDQKNKGHQSVLRWHVADNIPFQKSFDAYIEKYYGNDGGTLYACTAQWYLAPGGVDPYEPLPAEQRHGYCIKPEPVYADIRVLNEPNGMLQTQQLGQYPGGKWKNDRHLWWTGARPNDTLELAVPVTTAGKYQVSVNLTKANDYAIVQLSLDGKKLDEPIDLYNPEVVPSGTIALGTHELTAGQHTLSVKIVGANPEAQKAYMFGIDRIDLKAAGD